MSHGNGPVDSQPTDLFEDFISFIGVASHGMKRAMDEISVHRSQQQKAAAATGPMLELLMQHGLVLPHQKEAAAAMLGDHAGTLKMCKLAVDRIAALMAEKSREKKAASEPGAPAAENVTAPAYDSVNDPHVGRRTSQKKASDAAMLRVLDK